MQTGAEINLVHVIQQAVAPVFLLTGVGAMLGVLTNRLSRIIDRSRMLDERSRALTAAQSEEPALAHATADPVSLARMQQELAMLKRRNRWIHRAITLCTVCALLVCVVIATLFLGLELGFDPSRPVSLLFVTAMLSLIGGLLCFLREISLAA